MNVTKGITSASRISVISNGCRVASRESSVSSSSSQSKTCHQAAKPMRAHHNAVSTMSTSRKLCDGSLVVPNAARVTHSSTRLAKTFSASSALISSIRLDGHTCPNYGYVQSSTSANNKHHRMISSLASGKHTQHQIFRNVHLILPGSNMLSPAVSSLTNGNSLLATGSNGTINESSIPHLSSTVRSSSMASSSSILSETFCGLTGQAFNQDYGFRRGLNGSGWTPSELLGAIILASAATAGSLFLGPFGNLRDKGNSSMGNCGNGSSGPGEGGHKKFGGEGGGGDGNKGKLHHSTQPEVKVGIATSPPSYEVSVRALRGGRLSMEDEFIVVGGGRFSAVFDGHGGGGVSQYLRDHLHIILSEQLAQQEKNQMMSRKFRGDLKAFMFRKGHQKTNNNEQRRIEDCENNDKSTRMNPMPQMKYDLAGVGNLPVSAVCDALRDSFDQVDREILENDEYEYQGSTAIAVLLHEGIDGAKTILSANIGDSRGVLSRQGKAVDLTHDHKPNDDKEKARILAMGEKIEWDHYCKVHRVRNLSLSRAIGDRFAKPAVSGEVEIKRFPIYDDKDEFVLLASDGLWDVMTSQEVVSYVRKRLNAAPKDGAEIKTEEDIQSLKYMRRKNMSRFIANEALRRGSGDNISVVIVWLKDEIETDASLSLG